MRILSFRSAAVLLAASVGLAGCAYSPYGSGVSVGYGDPYGGYGSYGSYGGYGSPYGGYGGQYGYSPYYGWNSGYYYPGTGYYVYDRYRNPYYWSDAQRRYWEEQARRNRRENQTEVRANWNDFIRGQVVDVNDIRVTRPDGTVVNGTQQQQVNGQRVRPQRVQAQRVDPARQAAREERRQVIREAGERSRAEARQQREERRQRAD